jgi:hypothetical protein
MKNKLLFIVFFCISHISTAATGFPITPNTITVTSTSDDGSDGTLRWAINSANRFYNRFIRDFGINE